MEGGEESKPMEGLGQSFQWLYDRGGYVVKHMQTMPFISFPAILTAMRQCC